MISLLSCLIAAASSKDFLSLQSLLKKVFCVKSVRNLFFQWTHMVYSFSLTGLSNNPRVYHSFVKCSVNELLLWYDLCAVSYDVLKVHQISHDVIYCIGMHKTHNFTHRYLFTACSMAMSFCLTIRNSSKFYYFWFLSRKVFGGVWILFKYIHQAYS